MLLINVRLSINRGKLAREALSVCVHNADRSQMAALSNGQVTVRAMAPNNGRRGHRHEDWEFDDPAGQGIDAVRPIHDDINVRIKTLLAEVLPAAGAAGSSQSSPAELGMRATVEEVVLVGRIPTPHQPRKLLRTLRTSWRHGLRRGSNPDAYRRSSLRIPARSASAPGTTR